MMTYRGIFDINNIQMEENLIPIKLFVVYVSIFRVIVMSSQNFIIYILYSVLPILDTLQGHCWTAPIPSG
jgi:hypothetical protein